MHQVARETGGRVLGPVELPTVGRNYYRIRAEADGERLRLLLNAATSLVAAVEDSDTLVPAFRAVPRPDLFTAAGLHVAAPADLDALAMKDEAAWRDERAGYLLYD